MAGEEQYAPRQLETCGCLSMTDLQGVRGIFYCSLHKAAEKMLKALEAIEEGLAAIEPEFQAGPLVVVRTMQGVVRAAIAHAETGVAG